ncbi:hypothetical protein [Adlercreutzia shanghongiae]|uniref:Transposase n=1 Tax=Adlercreutzia shanghongiae TaxID=3111773 RepID=A0ABU6IW03_9ACTN|nr:hypothetical protein [Adlercreutzia sp. R22]MEC4294017.1 hypothetical protein [Adlercreutzia sp. R22]
MSQKKRVRPSLQAARTHVTEAMRLKPRPSVRHLDARRQRLALAAARYRSKAGDVAVFCAVAALSIALFVGGAR